MPEHSGLEILDFFDPNSIDFHIIFTTAYSEYALIAFELSAADYLVKPIQLEHIERAIRKVDKINTASYHVLKENLKEGNLSKKLLLNISGAQHVISTDEIVFIKADGSYSHVHMITNEKHCISKRVAEFEVSQNLGNFIRIHRSHIVNINHVEKILKNDGGIIVMKTGEELSISKEKKQELEQMLTYMKI